MQWRESRGGARREDNGDSTEGARRGREVPLWSAARRRSFPASSSRSGGMLAVSALCFASAAAALASNMPSERGTTFLGSIGCCAIIRPELALSFWAMTTWRSLRRFLLRDLARAADQRWISARCNKRS